MKYVFTFGYGHEPYGKCFVEIEAPDDMAVRKIMVETCCTHWASVYTSREAAGVEKYGLSEVSLETLQQSPPSTTRDEDDGGCPRCGRSAVVRY